MLPAPDAARDWLQTMMLVRRFEERAGEMYARAMVGGFLHLSIGEEAAIVGATRALRDSDYLVATYRSHGYPLARGTPPGPVMAELFGRVDRRQPRTRRLDAHVRPGAAVHGRLRHRRRATSRSPRAWPSRATTRRRDVTTLCVFGDAACNQGTFGETLNIAALWRLPVLFMVTNNQFGMGTSLKRHSAVTDLERKGEGLGVPGMHCDGMDVLDTYRVVSEALEIVRSERRPLLVEAITYRFRGHSMADPEEYRTREEVERWRERDPIAAFARRMVQDGVIAPGVPEELDAQATEAVEEAVRFAEESPFPSGASLYDDVYVLPGHRGRLVHRRERARARRARRHAGPGRARRRAPARGARRPEGTVSELRYREALRAALVEEMERDERVFIMGEDIGVFGGAFKVTEGLLERFGERRVRDTPISENSIVGIGIGAAMAGSAADRRADDDQLLAPGVRPDRQPRRAHPLHVRRPGPRAARRTHAAGRGPPARPDALPLLRGDLPPRPGAAGRDACDAGRREGPA